jgi:hypothetical protein
MKRKHKKKEIEELKKPKTEHVGTLRYENSENNK